MARIDPPGASGMGEHVDWSLHRTEMAIGMGTFSEAVYGNSKLPLREREAARWTIALINDCVVCQDTRAKDAAVHQVDEGFYADVAAWATTDALSEREKLAAEFAQRFALDHQAMDEAFWTRLRGAFGDDEVADLIICCGMFLGLGRAMAVVGVDKCMIAVPAAGRLPHTAPRGGPMAAHDLIIRGGTVLDGTGAPARTADIAASGGVITEVGQVDGPAAQELDADGLLVTPGLVDIHVHYDGQATWDDRLIPSAWHGVTTVVAGNCGVGFAPVRPADHDRLIELMEGVEDIPGAALHEGLPWTWQSFPEFLDALDGRRFDVDIATHVPHGALRLHVMGERGAQREMATPEDVDAMATLARQAIDAGAIGFSTSRTRNHRSSNGELTPTLTADADELLGIARAIGATGTGVLQVVSDFDDVDAEFGLFRSMAEASGRPLSFSLAGVDPAKYPRQLELLDAANAAGVRMRGQAAARAIGILVGLQCTINPLAGNPLWQEIAGLPVAEQARAMAEPSFKERFLAAAERSLGGADRMFELGDPPDYEPDPSTSIAARAARDGRDALELAYDLLAQDDGRTFLYVPIINWFDGTLDGVGEMLAHAHTVPGLSDGGAHVGTICDASFPTTLLAHWGRDRDHGRIALPYLVRQHTKDTAETVGLLDRGVLAPGYRADVNLIDFDALRVRRPEMRYDLPAGGKRLLQRADGYHTTIVKGEVTYQAGEPTEALPGRLLRGAQAAPAR